MKVNQCWQILITFFFTNLLIQSKIMQRSCQYKAIDFNQGQRNGEQI